MNKYKELRDRQQAEVNALPLGFAFGKSQFDEMMRGWGLDPEKDLDKIVSIGAGGYIQKKDRSLMHETFDRHRREPGRRLSPPTKPAKGSSSICSCTSSITMSTATPATPVRPLKPSASRPRKSWTTPG